MRLDHLLSTENIILVPGMVSRGSSLRVPGVLAWNGRCAPFGAGTGMLLGSLAATAPGGGSAYRCPPWPVASLVGLVGCGVAWWFENWIVDASGPCRCCTVVVCLY